MLGSPLQFKRPAGEDNKNHGLPGCDDRLEQLLLVAREAEVDAA